MPLTLYELWGATDKRFSPFCWRTRMALAHKGLEPDEIIPVGFTEKEKIAFSGQDRVPVIVDNGKTVFDSWSIACYLEDTYPTHPALFGSATARGEALFINSWADRVFMVELFPMVVKDVFDHVREEDREHFRETREKWMKGQLEEVQAKRDERIESFRKRLDVLRHTLGKEPFLCGETPAYGDYIVFGVFQWARCVSPFILLAEDDPIRQWRERMLDLFDGYARNFDGYPC
ncbi:MAG: glutathione S-transferase family protein [Alphaproteobacteria bacterium]|nr:glutathione S-transferase family protein [Alphaproteobacteria bacterium]